MNSYSKFIHYKNCIMFLNLFNVRSCKDLAAETSARNGTAVDYEGLEILSFVQYFTKIREIFW
jgi:hypothetical protein